MVYKIRETFSARQDLENIVQYLVSSLENPPAAAAFLDEVEDCYGHLESMPLMFEACRSPHLRARGYRKVLIKNYILVYTVDESNQTVDILRFFHGSQDYEKLL